jgi:hypothetical protein
LYCCEEESKQFIKTGNHYTLFFKINIICVKKMWSNLWLLWMHQTKYFELSMFFDYLCVFSPSLAWIIRSLLYLAWTAVV